VEFGQIMISNCLRKPQWVALALATPLLNAVGSLVILRKAFGAPLLFALVIFSFYLAITLLSVSAAKGGRLSLLLIVVNGVSLVANVAIFVLIRYVEQHSSTQDFSFSGFAFVTTILVTAISSLIMVVYAWVFAFARDARDELPGQDSE